jgi:hypothetical protein
LRWPRFSNPGCRIKSSSPLILAFASLPAGTFANVRRPAFGRHTPGKDSTANMKFLSALPPVCCRNFKFRAH